MSLSKGHIIVCAPAGNAPHASHGGRCLFKGRFMAEQAVSLKTLR